ncbi:MAG: formyltetrahydrofolate deformylase [Candidatus Marinimicrobia bacterium]|jgi:formyltetrahydrofolate deformylase|nr:formyltetrahydrofolate deformylase [Candidatus Neomarinimicrobiota bacterium]
MRDLILHINCPDQRGIIAQFTGVLYDHGANVLNLEQHVEPDAKLFFMRIHADLSNMEISEDALHEILMAQVKKMNAKIQFYYPENRQKMAIFVTREAAPLYDLLIKHQSGELPCEIPCILSNHQDLKNTAKQFNIPFHHLPLSPETKSDQENAVREIIKKENIDLLVLARYMQILSTAFVTDYQGRIINIHHGFLPAFKGNNPYRKAWERGVKMIGATAHYVTADLDEGPIIEQDVVSVNHQHSVQEMIQAGRDIERRVLTSAVKAHLQHRIILDGQRTIIFHT